MRSAKDFFRPLAVGAPDPVREVPARPSRMIHFFDPSNPKMAAKVPDMVGTVDVLLGNLEDAVKAENKEAARQGLVDIARATDFGEHTQLWTRVNALESPWVLDDLTTLVTEIGDRLDVVMVPKVQGPEDIHYVDRLLAQLEAKAGLTRPDFQTVVDRLVNKGYDEIVVVPLLLTEAYHAKVDVPEAVAAATARHEGLKIRADVLRAR